MLSNNPKLVHYLVYVKHPHQCH